MATVLGMEGGGSHGHAVVADTSGHVRGIGKIADSTNWEDVGFEAAGAAIKACVRWALDGSGVAPEDVTAAVFSLAGVDFPLDVDLLGGIPTAVGLSGTCRIINDAYSSLRAGTERPFGVVAAAGTGSIVAGRNPDGREFRTLGLGPMFGDWGSASEVSEAGVSAVADEYTRRGQPTRLSGDLCRAAGAESVPEFLEAVGRERIDSEIFAPVVIRAAEEGDRVAIGILGRAGRSLGQTSVHVIRTLEMEDLEFDLVLAGGLFRGASRFLLGAFEEVVRPVAPNAVPQVLRELPVIGSVLLAIELAGEKPRPHARRRLIEGTREQR